MKIFVGIDPGMAGAIALQTELKSVVYDLPFLAKSFDVKAFQSCLFSLGKDVFVIIEELGIFGKGSIQSATTSGKNYGKIIAVLELADIPYQEVPSSKWKKMFCLIKKEKSDSCIIAKQLFPTHTFKTPRGRLLDGRAEALLLSEYGKRIKWGV